MAGISIASFYVGRGWIVRGFGSDERWVGCHAHGVAWAWGACKDSMPTQSRGHGTHRHCFRTLQGPIAAAAGGGTVRFVIGKNPSSPTSPVFCLRRRKPASGKALGSFLNVGHPP